MNLSLGIKTLNITYENGRVLCKYRRMLNGNGSFMANLTKDQFAIWAYGDQNSGPGSHTATGRGATATAVNLQFMPQVIVFEHI